MEIKSRVLLPGPEGGSAAGGEAEDGLDPRAELVARLLEYERFQHVAERLRALALHSQRSFPRPAAERWEGALPLVELRPAHLLEALRVMRRVDGERGTPRPALRVRRQAIHLHQRVADVLRRVLAAGGPLPFTRLLYRGRSRLPRREVLVTFLAVLELVRMERITAWQQGPLGEILLTPRSSARS
jgi:segregation and condensation protein A